MVGLGGCSGRPRGCSDKGNVVIGCVVVGLGRCSGRLRGCGDKGNVAIGGVVILMGVVILGVVIRGCNGKDIVVGSVVV